MTFTQQLRETNQDLFEMIFHHPFVEGIGRGDIAKEAVMHYVKADFEYLNAFMKIYAIAMSKSDTRSDIAFFHEQVGFTLHSETGPHMNLCDYIGVSYKELQGHPLPPTADHYVKHMMYHAYTGSLGEIYAALLPCPWTYLEIGKVLMEKYKPQANHPFYRWITFYADSGIEALTETLCKRLDACAEEASEAEKNRMRDAFRKSCQLELCFWEMSLTCETWPAGNIGVTAP
ncbi:MULTISPECIES: thiaminase II [Paenibacillus]|uniref:Aminopyrimidine aminohydrolase n=1 Tax=Paenibacillus residui TaxID=629724 RepID=A0ABW3DAM3_9BACL